MLSVKLWLLARGHLLGCLEAKLTQLLLQAFQCLWGEAIRVELYQKSCAFQ